jgi:hypothetical protein
MGPLSPATWKLTASFRPSSAALVALVTKGSAVASLQADSPGAIVIAGRPSKVTRRLVPATIAELPRCRPTWTSSKVTGAAPCAFDSRMRAARPQMDGRMISRND